MLQLNIIDKYFLVFLTIQLLYSKDNFTIYLFTIITLYICDQLQYFSLIINKITAKIHNLIENLHN